MFLDCFCPPESARPPWLERLGVTRCISASSYIPETLRQVATCDQSGLRPRFLHSWTIIMATEGAFSLVQHICILQVISVHLRNKLLVDATLLMLETRSQSPERCDYLLRSHSQDWVPGSVEFQACACNHPPQP